MRNGRRRRRWRNVATAGAALLGPSLVALVTLAGLAPVARAQSKQPVILQWTAPPAECPDAVYVQAEIIRLLGGATSASGDSRVTARAKVAQGNGGWRVDLTTSAVPAEGGAPTGGSRTLEADSCRALADATALILALTVNPARVAESAASASASSPSTGAPEPANASANAAPSATASISSIWSIWSIATGAASASAAPIASSVVSAASSTKEPAPTLTEFPPLPAPRSPTRLGLSLSLGALLDVGSFPSAAFGVGGALGVRIEHLRVELGGAFLPTQRTTLDLRPGAGTDFRMISGRLRAGWALGARVEVTPVVGVELAQLRAGGVGVLVPDTGTTGRTALTFGALLGVPLTGPLGLRAELEALAPTTRTEFVIDGVGATPSQLVHREPVVIGRLLLGVEVRLGE